ncbi:MAG TPA: hypothetical protein VGM32_20800 [Rhodopila sp.]
MKSHRTRRSLFCGLLLTLCCRSAPGQEAVIGYVKSAEGIVTITHGQQTTEATPGAPVHEGDTLRTFWTAAWA